MLQIHPGYGNSCVYQPVICEDKRTSLLNRDELPCIRGIRVTFRLMSHKRWAEVFEKCTHLLRVCGNQKL